MKAIIEFGFRMISRSIKRSNRVICLSPRLRFRQITPTSALIIHEILIFNQ